MLLAKARALDLKNMEKRLGEVMAYLYLNFEENLQSGSKNWDDFYTESLQAQYEKLKIKLAISLLKRCRGSSNPLLCRKYRTLFIYLSPDLIVGSKRISEASNVFITL